jgi:hypothetical protein
LLTLNLSNSLISRSVKKDTQGNLKGEEKDVKRALEHATALVMDTKGSIQESITYDLLYAIHKLKLIQEEKENHKRQLMQNASTLESSVNSIFADPVHADYEVMDRLLESGLKQLKDKERKDYVPESYDDTGIILDFSFNDGR